MTNYDTNELVFVNDPKKGISSCGYQVNSLLLNTSQKPSKQIDELFNNLVVPNWTLNHGDKCPKVKERKTGNDEEEYMEIVDDNLFDKLVDLVSQDKIETAIIIQNSASPKPLKHKKTRSILKLKKKQSKENKDREKNGKKKKNKTRKKKRSKK